MLLKYLNQLDEAVHQAERDPSPESLSLCADRMRVLEEYLESQVEPVRRRGREIMDTMVPPALYARISCSPVSEYALGGATYLAPHA